MDICNYIMDRNVTSSQDTCVGGNLQIKHSGIHTNQYQPEQNIEFLTMDKSSNYVFTNQPVDKRARSDTTSTSKEQTRGSVVPQHRPIQTNEAHVRVLQRIPAQTNLPPQLQQAHQRLPMQANPLQHDQQVHIRPEQYTNYAPYRQMIPGVNHAQTHDFSPHIHINHPANNQRGQIEGSNVPGHSHPHLAHEGNHARSENKPSHVQHRECHQQTFLQYQTVGSTNGLMSKGERNRAGHIYHSPQGLSGPSTTKLQMNGYSGESEASTNGYTSGTDASVNGYILDQKVARLPTQYMNRPTAPAPGAPTQSHFPFDPGVSVTSDASSRTSSASLGSRDVDGAPFESVSAKLSRASDNLLYGGAAENAYAASDDAGLDDEAIDSDLTKAEVRKLFAFQYASAGPDESYSASTSTDDTRGRDAFSPTLDQSLQQLSDAGAYCESEVRPKVLQDRLDRAIQIARKFKYKYKREKVERERMLQDVQACEKKCVQQVDVMAHNFFAKIHELKRRLRAAATEKEEQTRRAVDLSKENEFLRANYSNAQQSCTSLQQLQLDLHRAQIDTQRQSERADEQHKRNRQLIQTKQKLEAELRHSLSEIQSHRAVINTLIQTNHQLLDTKRKLEQELHLCYQDAQLQNQRADSLAAQNEQLMASMQKCLQEAQYLKDRISQLSGGPRTHLSQPPQCKPSKTSEESDTSSRRRTDQSKGHTDAQQTIESLSRERDDLRAQLAASGHTVARNAQTAYNKHSVRTQRTRVAGRTTNIQRGMIVTCEHGCHDLQTGRAIVAAPHDRCTLTADIDSQTDTTEDMSVRSGELGSGEMLMHKMKLKKAVSNIKGRVDHNTQALSTDSQNDTYESLIFDKKSTRSQDALSSSHPISHVSPPPQEVPEPPPKEVQSYSVAPGGPSGGRKARASSPDRRQRQTRNPSRPKDARLTPAEGARRREARPGRSSAPLPERRRKPDYHHIAACTESILNQMDLAVGWSADGNKRPHSSADRRITDKRPSSSTDRRLTGDKRPTSAADRFGPSDKRPSSAADKRATSTARKVRQEAVERPRSCSPPVDSMPTISRV